MKDQNKLSKLIKLAQGERTQNEYASRCGISSPSITRICSGAFNPKPSQLKKLASKARSGVTYEMLMAAAGYLELSEEYPTNEIKKPAESGGGTTCDWTRTSDYTVNSVREVVLIEVKVDTGNGTEDSFAREVTEFWTKDGKLVARIDPRTKMVPL